MSVTIEQRQLNVTEPVGWFMQLDELRPVGPGEVQGADHWLALDNGEVVGRALVSTSYADDANAHVFRIGVLPEHRRKGICRALLERLAEEYGSLELECRESLEANKVYERLGWEQTGKNYGDPEDLLQWRFDP